MHAGPASHPGNDQIEGKVEGEERVMNPDNIIRPLGKLMGLMGLYSPGHPVVDRTLSELIDNTNRYFSSNPELSIGIIEHKLVFEEMQVEDCGLIETEMINIFEKAGIDSVTLINGVTKEEMSFLCSAIVSCKHDMEKLLSDNGAVHIRVNTERYTKIKDGEITASEKTGSVYLPLFMNNLRQRWMIM